MLLVVFLAFLVLRKFSFIGVVDFVNCNHRDGQNVCALTKANTAIKLKSEVVLFWKSEKLPSSVEATEYIPLTNRVFTHSRTEETRLVRYLLYSYCVPDGFGRICIHADSEMLQISDAPQKQNESV